MGRCADSKSRIDRPRRGRAAGLSRRRNSGRRALWCTTRPIFGRGQNEPRATGCHGIRGGDASGAGPPASQRRSVSSNSNPETGASACWKRARASARIRFPAPSWNPAHWMRCCRGGATIRRPSACPRRATSSAYFSPHQALQIAVHPAANGQPRQSDRLPRVNRPHCSAPPPKDSESSISGFAAAEALSTDDGAVKGIRIGDMGVEKSGQRVRISRRVAEIHAKLTFSPRAAGAACRNS